MNANDSHPIRGERLPATVVIPLYTLALSVGERYALRHTLTVLAAHDVAVVVPDGLDVEPLPDLLGMEPNWREERFDPSFFDGRQGYNRLMTSADFYRRFAATADYVLVCQSDAWVFADELSRWCAAGYDYVGAPWLPDRRSVNGHWPLHRLFWQARKLSGSRTARLKWNVGNGGFSLRRAATLADFADCHARDIARLCSPHHSAAVFEDVFWGIEANRLEPGALRVAPWREALAFSVESHPDYALRLLGGRLPFGTHAFARRRNCRHWRGLIPDEAFDSII